MRSLFTRAAQHKKGHRLTPVAFIVFAAAVFVIVSSAIGKAALRAPADNITTGSLPPASALIDEDKFIRHAKSGKEGLQLAARLTQTGGFIQRPISWKIFKRDPDIGTLGPLVYSKTTPIIEAPLQPGSYRIEAAYGFATTTRDVTVLPKTRLGLTLILNVGGVRTLSRVSGMDASHYSDARHAIIALPDNKPEKLITEHISQGEIVRLPAGQYRIESRFNNGNTLATALVTIKPGILTSLNIDHQAALAKLSLQSGKFKPVTWRVYSHKGNWTKTGHSHNPAMVLAPGRYTFSAKFGQKSISRIISLVQGKATTIVLGK